MSTYYYNAHLSLTVWRIFFGISEWDSPILRNISKDLNYFYRLNIPLIENRIALALIISRVVLFLCQTLTQLLNIYRFPSGDLLNPNLTELQSSGINFLSNCTVSLSTSAKVCDYSRRRMFQCLKKYFLTDEIKL